MRISRLANTERKNCWNHLRPTHSPVNTPMKPLPILRQGGYHDTVPDLENPSAASLRAAADFLPFVPEETRRCYENRPQYRLAYGERAMAAWQEYKKNPDAYPGHVGDVSNVLRAAVTGRTKSPDLCSIMKALGKEKVLERVTWRGREGV